MDVFYINYVAQIVLNRAKRLIYWFESQSQSNLWNLFQVNSKDARVISNPIRCSIFKMTFSITETESWTKYLGQALDFI